MKTPKYQARGSLEFNMTPMIDVTFQLIIFFLVSSHLAQQETQIEMQLPQATSGADARDDVRRVTVNLTSAGAMLVAGESLDADSLGRRLAAERAKDDTVEVRIRCDRAAMYGRVKPIMKTCLEQNIRRVTFAVVKAE